MTNNNQPLYLDYNATTPLDPRVFGAMQEWFVGTPSNSGSRTHVFGQQSREAVDTARKQIADTVGAGSEEIFFTSGATESNNIAILGLSECGLRTNRKHILSTTIEHKAVLEPLDQMRSRGFEVELVPVSEGGFVDVDAVQQRLRPDTLLVSVMHANNETGVLQPVSEIAELLAGTETLFHTDVAQTFGKEVETLRNLQCDFMSISSHKICGPQGVGALFVRRRGAERRLLDPLFFGGGQERGLRPGTIPVALVVGLGTAIELAAREYAERRDAALRVKEQLITGLVRIEHRVNGAPERTQSHVLNVSFPGVDSEALMMALRNEVAISNGSACTSASYNPSHVLMAMGMNEDRINESVRISWGPGVTEIPVDKIVSAVENMCMSF
jgi:cysteine desulfurase